MKKQPKKTLKTTKNDTTPAGLIQAAVVGGADLEKLSGLLDLQLRWEANEAKKAYVKDMVAFQSDPPSIGKDKHVEFKSKVGQLVKYNHATLPNVVKKIERALSTHGFSVSFPGHSDEKGISVTCKITHIMGHSEETTLKAPSDTTGSKNAIQAIGSAVSYLQRYTLLSLTGLATEDMDDDGKGTDPPKKGPAKPPTKEKPETKTVDRTPVTVAQATIIIQNMIGSHLTHNYEKWLWAESLFKGITKHGASKIIYWWLGDKKKNIKGQWIKRGEIEKKDKEGKAIGDFLVDVYEKYVVKSPDEIKKYNHYCGLDTSKVPFNILDKKSLMGAYLQYRKMSGMDNDAPGLSGTTEGDAQSGQAPPGESK